MSNISLKVIQEIQEKRLAPLPKWHFLLKNSFLWSIFCVTIITGSIAAAISIFLISNTDLLSIVRFSDIFSYIPIFWLVLLALFLYVAIHNFIHTEEGYRWNTMKVFMVSIVLSLFIGWGIVASGTANRVNTYFAQVVPYYQVFGDSRALIWNNPAAGRIAGKIISVNVIDKVLELQDLSGFKWNVDYTESVVKPSVSLTTNIEIKVLGTKQGTSTFTASEIRPWNGSGTRNGMQGNGRGQRNTR